MSVDPFNHDNHNIVLLWLDWPLDFDPLICLRLELQRNFKEKITTTTIFTEDITSKTHIEQAIEKKKGR